MKIVRKTAGFLLVAIALVGMVALDGFPVVLCLATAGFGAVIAID